MPVTPPLERNLATADEAPAASSSSAVRAGDAGADSSFPNPLEYRRVLFGITAFNRKQHVHLKQMVLAVVSMCEAGMDVTVLLYTADTNLYTDAETHEMEQLGFCTRIQGSVDIRILVRSAELQLKMTMEHRQEFKSMLDDYDLFIYTEDDMQVDFRHLTAYIAESHRLRNAAEGDKYLIGYLRYEENGISTGHTQVIWENSDDAWFPVEIDGKLYMMPQNVHGGLYVSTRDELKVAIRIPPNKAKRQQILKKILPHPLFISPARRCFKRNVAF